MKKFLLFFGFFLFSIFSRAEPYNYPKKIVTLVKPWRTNEFFRVTDATVSTNIFRVPKGYIFLATDVNCVGTSATMNLFNPANSNSFTIFQVSFPSGPTSVTVGTPIPVSSRVFMQGGYGEEFVLRGYLSPER